ncbi:CCA tRNA nucleotidyltransferase [Falsiroseomonas tokyonensis]|uniref:CCA tRNA nucleotidyltransferase n=1 Tax=Falsiroseomonas tokyonensis TaxID=430521 RepID=A0ABV7BQD0_9PROT|nr:CCA tRNA nucleotidyltransferase [Falsiroseomonas tokyonensis]MBU8536313.1 CCA tRNA nucleotidyltransferase [Falsiroseomonas tokyonensis]
MNDPPQDRIPPPAFLAEPAPAAVLAALPGARAVGGCVRDALAGRPVHDVDVAAPYPPEVLAEKLHAAGLKVFETGLAHGTVTAVLRRTPVEVTALRRDLVTDGRHAEVAWTTDWREDAARRDFSFNAMSMDAEGHLWDYFGGRADLAAGRVRFVGDAATRLAEDYLRALRFFRFWARYGQGAPDPAALAAIRDAVPGFAARIAPERIWMELKRLLPTPDPSDALALMAQTGLLAAVLPEGADPERLRRMIARGLPPDPLLRLAVLLDEAADTSALATRLRLSGEERDRLAVLHHPPAPPRPGQDVPLRAWRARLRAASRHVMPPEPLWVAEARMGGAGWESLRAAVAPGDAEPEFPLQGRDLMPLGIPPGPGLGVMLGALRRWWLEGDCQADPETLLAEARRRLEKTGTADGPAAPDRKADLPGS